MTKPNEGSWRLDSLSRRDFLKLSSTASLGLLLSACGLTPSPAATEMPAKTKTLTPSLASTSTPTVASIATSTATPSATSTGTPIMMVSARRTPKEPWQEYPTRTLTSVPGAADIIPDGNLSQYGGLRSNAVKESGFFRVEKIGGRWWLVDPEGNLFIHKAIVNVQRENSSANKAAFQKQFATEQNWAEETSKLLKANGFNGTGAWSANNTLRRSSVPLVYTSILNFMDGYGKKRGGTTVQPGHTGYPNDAIFVFDPAFEKFCDETARILQTTKDDPFLLGHFSDNELPFPEKALDKYLALPSSDSGNQAAKAWLTARNPKENAITNEHRRAFLKYVVEYYFRITSSAIKKYDPNHLFLGSRFYGSDLAQQAIFEGAAPFLDVVSINYYDEWTPNRAKMGNWEKWSGRPFIVTEFYTKGEDSGLPNNTGAGWIVRTQQDRGWFYQNFCIGLLENRACVGWHWFQYMDNDPSDLSTDPSNRDSNKGIVTTEYKLYQSLLDAMRELNGRVYSLIAPSITPMATDKPIEQGTWTSRRVAGGNLYDSNKAFQYIGEVGNKQIIDLLRGSLLVGIIAEWDLTKVTDPLEYERIKETAKIILRSNAKLSRQLQNIEEYFRKRFPNEQDLANFVVIIEKDQVVDVLSQGKEAVSSTGKPLGWIEVNYGQLTVTDKRIKVTRNVTYRITGDITHYQMNGENFVPIEEPRLQSKLECKNGVFLKDGKEIQLRGAVSPIFSFDIGSDSEGFLDRFKKDIAIGRDLGMNFLTVVWNAAFVDDPRYLDSLVRALEEAYRLGIRVELCLDSDGMTGSNYWESKQLVAVSDRLNEAWNGLLSNPKIPKIAERIGKCVSIYGILYEWDPTKGGARNLPEALPFFDAAAKTIRNNVGNDVICTSIGPDYAGDPSAFLAIDPKDRPNTIIEYHPYNKKWEKHNLPDVITKLRNMGYACLAGGIGWVDPPQSITDQVKFFNKEPRLSFAFWMLNTGVNQTDRIFNSTGNDYVLTQLGEAFADSLGT